MEIASFVLRSVDVMQRVMDEIVDPVTHNEADPESKINMVVAKVNEGIDKEVAKRECNDSQCRREDNTVSEYK